MCNDEIILRGRLNGNQKNRLTKLLDMPYSPIELAQEIGFTQRQVYRVYVPLGCPHTRDNERHIWINGKEFREWIKIIYLKRKLKINEAFCLTCKKAVPMHNKVRKNINNLFYYQCECPNCGRVLNRIITRGKKIE